MTGRSRDDISLAPEAAPERAAYERDAYTWSREQARLIREGRWNEVDRHNVAEEIESVGRTEFSRLESALRIILLHMLKWDHQPDRRSRSWALSIAAQRIELDDVIGDNPGLKPRLADAMTRAYRRARIEAARETGLATDRFASDCSYGWDDVRGRSFEA